MNFRRTAALAACLVLFSSSAYTPAKEDNAFCEMRSGGKTRKGQTGECRVTKNEGKVRIHLPNGVTHTLKPTNVKNQYRDQNGKKVVRVVTKEGEEEVYKWENRRLVVSWR